MLQSKNKISCLSMAQKTRFLMELRGELKKLLLFPLDKKNMGRSKDLPEIVIH